MKFTQCCVIGSLIGPYIQSGTDERVERPIATHMQREDPPLLECRTTKGIAVSQLETRSSSRRTPRPPQKSSCEKRSGRLSGRTQRCLCAMWTRNVPFPPSPSSFHAFDGRAFDGHRKGICECAIHILSVCCCSDAQLVDCRSDVLCCCCMGSSCCAFLHCQHVLQLQGCLWRRVSSCR